MFLQEGVWGNLTFDKKWGSPNLFPLIHSPHPSPAAALEEIAQQTEALGSQNRLGVKLDPIHRQVPVTQPHDLSHCGLRRHRQGLVGAEREIEHAAKRPAGWMDTEHLDAELLGSVIESVDQLLDDQDFEADGKLRARLYIAAYEDSKEKGKVQLKQARAILIDLTRRKR